MSGWLGCRSLLLACAALLAILGQGADARADEVRVKGTVLRGKVVTVTTTDVVFETEYGKGSIVIPIEDVEDIQSEASFRIVHGEEGVAEGRLVGIRDGKLLVGEEATTASLVDPNVIVVTHAAADYDQPLLGTLRRQFELWSGSFDLGFGLTQATTDTTGFAVGFVTDRKKRPSRITFQTGYRYGTQKQSGDDRSTIENQLVGLLRGEYDVLPRTYVFGSGDAMYDEIQHLSIRAVPKAGLGYRIWEAKDGLLQLEMGPSYVYENYFSQYGGTNDYFAVAFGKLLETALPYFGSTFRWRTDYLPAVDDFTGDYLLRTEAALLVPMMDYLSFRLSVANQYDSTPAEDAKHNTLNTSAGVSFVY
jgi:putative salt-induced outer membrane protein YdiY